MGRGECPKFILVLGGNGTKKNPSGDIFDQHPGEMSWIRGKLGDHVGDHVVPSPEGAVLVTSPGTESSNLPFVFVERLQNIFQNGHTSSKKATTFRSGSDRLTLAPFLKYHILNSWSTVLAATPGSYRDSDRKTPPLSIFVESKTWKTTRFPAETRPTPLLLPLLCTVHRLSLCSVRFCPRAGWFKYQRVLSMVRGSTLSLFRTLCSGLMVSRTLGAARTQSTFRRRHRQTPVRQCCHRRRRLCSVESPPPSHPREDIVVGDCPSAGICRGSFSSDSPRGRREGADSR